MLKRSPMPAATKPMKRGAFNRVDRIESGAVSKIRNGIKPSRPKMTPIRKAARLQDCTLRIPGVCNWNPETTVLCHSPYLESGRGMGLKAPDEEACFGCSLCHDMLDRRTPWPSWMTPFKMEGFFVKAMNTTHVILKAKGLLP